MKEQLITFNTAKLAKEKRLCYYFNKGTEYVNAFYSIDKITFEETEFQQEDCIIEDRYFRPTQGLLQKWLREIHRINVESNWLPNIQKYRCLFKPMDIKPKDFNSCSEYYKLNNKYYGTTNYNTYEEALEDGLYNALLLIK